MSVEVFCQGFTFTLDDLRTHSATDEGVFLEGCVSAMKKAGIRRSDLKICGCHIGFPIEKASGPIRDLLGENKVADYLESSPKTRLFLLVRENELGLLGE